MASFKDTFTRDEGGEKNLQYDDAAFYYFFSAILLVILIPLGYSIITHVLKRKPYLNPYFKRGLSQNGDIAAYNTTSKEKNAWFNWKLVFKVLVFVALIFLYFQVVEKTAGDSRELKGFDPYEILELDTDADEAAVKRAYRRLVVIYHPDKNPDDAKAAAKFIMITKAYECLTDETSKANCEKFGNPDGQASTFSVAIALPSVLLKKENHIVVLSIFFFSLLVILPATIMCWYSESSKYDIDGILIENKRMFYQFLNENTTSKGMPRNLSACAEYRDNWGVTHAQQQDIMKIHTQVLDGLGGTKPNIEPKLVKPNYLIHAWMMGIPVGKSLTSDLTQILKHAPELVEGMIIFALSFPRMQRMKVFGLRCALAAIEFSQYFFQGLWFKDPALLQLACMDKNKLAKAAKGKKALPSFLQLVKMTPEERNSLAFVAEEDKAAFAKEIAEFPNITVSHSVFVEDEEGVTVGDFATLKVTLTRENVDPKEPENAYAKSFRYPNLKHEKWYIIVCDEVANVVVFQKQVPSIGKKPFEEKFRFPAQVEGKKTIKLMVKSDCYRELDQEFDVEIKISARVADGENKFKYHAEDEALDRQPSMYRQMMNSMMKKDDSDEELEEEANAKKSKSPGKNREDGEEVEGGQEEEQEEEEEEQKVDARDQKNNQQQPNKQDIKDKKNK
jgi:translocation protein SEC63